MELASLRKVAVMLMLASFAILARFLVDYLKEPAKQYLAQTFRQLFEQLAEHFPVDESNPFYSEYVSIDTQLRTAAFALSIVFVLLLVVSLALVLKGLRLI